ncbi:MAG: 2-C-methyl-D-erythritol 4-phosphate cytidylyltransferase, partial [Gammaproteobacteria bacterium]|nr:2-C-methyl-D-erythritol 4-phosphate cytidylyltransferase [Gammaproteobacteria bacterium]
ALTPQMFHLGALIDALENALSNNLIVTDEAQAIELNGLQPVLVEGHPGNIKITRNNDLALAELFLSQQEND